MQSIESRFAALHAGTEAMAATTAAQRIERLERLLAAVLDNKQRFYDAAYQEIKACDLDVAAQLVMIKTEVDFFRKHLARWMRPRRC